MITLAILLLLGLALIVFTIISVVVVGSVVKKLKVMILIPQKKLKNEIL